MGSVGGSTKSKIIYAINTEKLDNYYYREGQKADMQDALTDAQNAINSIMSGSYAPDSVDALYESLTDWFPQTIDGDEAEKVILADKEYITTVRFDIWEDRDGKINASLNPSSYSIDEFSEQELNDMGIDKEYLRERKH